MKNQLKEEKAKREFGRWSDYCLGFFLNYENVLLLYENKGKRERGK